MILEILNVTCEDSGLTLLISTIKRGLTLIWVIAPILAMMGITYALVKLMSTPFEKKYKNLIKNSVISLAVVFLVPTLVNTVMVLFDDTFEISACWNSIENASSVASQRSHYIDINNRPRHNIFTDPSEYKTGEKNS